MKNLFLLFFLALLLPTSPTHAMQKHGKKENQQEHPLNNAGVDKAPPLVDMSEEQAELNLKFLKNQIKDYLFLNVPEWEIKITPVLLESQNFIKNQQGAPEQLWGNLEKAKSLLKKIQNYIDSHGNAVIRFLKTQELPPILLHDLDNATRNDLQKNPNLATYVKMALFLEENRENSTVPAVCHLGFKDFLNNKENYKKVEEKFFDKVHDTAYDKIYERVNEIASKLAKSSFKKNSIQEKCRIFLEKNIDLFQYYPSHDMNSIKNIELSENDAARPCLKHPKVHEYSDYCINCIFRNTLETILKLKEITERVDLFYLFQNVNPDSETLRICQQKQFTGSLTSEAKLLKEQLTEDIQKNLGQDFFYNILLCANHLEAQEEAAKEFKQTPGEDPQSIAFVKTKCLRYFLKTSKEMMADKRLYLQQYDYKYLGYKPVHTKLMALRQEFLKTRNIEQMDHVINEYNQFIKTTKEHLEEFK